MEVEAVGSLVRQGYLLRYRRRRRRPLPFPGHPGPGPGCRGPGLQAKSLDRYTKLQRQPAWHQHEDWNQPRLVGRRARVCTFSLGLCRR
jgi:hypothetical protein